MTNPTRARPTAEGVYAAYIVSPDEHMPSVGLAAAALAAADAYYADLVAAAREVVDTTKDPTQIDKSVGVFMCPPSPTSIDRLAAALRGLGR